MTIDYSRMREIVGDMAPIVRKKVYRFINAQMQDFIACSPLVMLATQDEDGFPTVSPKGDCQGFIRLENNDTLYMPELRGNRMALSLTNIIEGRNKAALLFIVPGTAEVLRVQGEVELIEPAQMPESVRFISDKVLLAWKFKVHKAFFHCSNALTRSGTWDQSRWPEVFPLSFAQEIENNPDFPE